MTAFEKLSTAIYSYELETGVFIKVIEVQRTDLGYPKINMQIEKKEE